MLPAGEGPRSVRRRCSGGGGEDHGRDQRPVTDVALGEPATNAAWKAIPSWSIYGDSDKNIPPQAMAWMAKRAGSKETVVVRGASHVVMVSHPDKVADIIEDAAAAK